MPRVIAAIIRHGDYHQLVNTPSAHQPFPLTPQGEQQAQAAAGEIVDLARSNEWQLATQIDSSRLLRAWQTASIIAQSATGHFDKHPVVADYDALAERAVGSVANLSMTEIEALAQQDPRFPKLPSDWKSNSEFCLPFQGAESLLAAGKRVAQHLRQQMAQLRKDAQRDTLKLFVGHGAAFRHAAFHLGVLAFEDIAKLSMYHAKPVCLELLPDDRWVHVAGQWKVRGQKTEYTD